MATVQRATDIQPEHRTLIPDVSYALYKTFCDEIGSRGPRLSFINGMLEIMITKSPHEFYKKKLAKLAIDDSRDETTCVRQYMNWLHEHRQR